MRFSGARPYLRRAMATATGVPLPADPGPQECHQGHLYV